MATSLVLLRHAKATSPLGVPDIDRPLADRGRRDARAAGDFLRQSGVIPGQVACSPARRTRQTLEGLRFTAPVEYDRRIYGGEPDTLLDVIGEQPEDADTLLVIGHNPSMYELCTLLTGTEPPRFPTAALALIEVAGAWSGVAGERARLVELWTPRD